METPKPERRDDYVWHFKLEADAEAPLADEALTEMVRRQVAALLRCLRFTSGGSDVVVTGFRFLDDPSREHLLAPPPRDEAPGEAERPGNKG